ncbi:MAG: hypothetical protein MZV64_53820 [Ignavibacteriales bacterium]|nr:hypothetical protein [Ignavibacteriales bacterium]
MRNDELIVAPAYGINKELCKIGSSGIRKFLLINIPIEISDMETIENSVVAPGRSFRQYSICAYCKEDSI